MQEFDGKKFILVPRGHYVELNFTIRSYFPQTCLWGFNLEIRDGRNQATNLLGEFCGDYGTGVVRSSGRYMWLKFIRTDLYNYISVFYTARSINETGMMFLSINIYIYIYMYTRFQKRCNLKLHMNIYICLCLFIKKCLFLIRKEKIYTYHVFSNLQRFMYVCIYLYMHVCMCLSIYLSIYLSITNCRQYCFGLLGLISAVLMLRWR